MNNNLKNLIRSSLFLAMAIVFQLMGRSFPQINQYFVGPAVNAVLLITAAVSGIYFGVIVGALTPLLAWFSGILAAPLGPFIPFIITANIIYVVTFSIFKSSSKGKYIGLVLGSFFKFGFLYFSAVKLIHVFNLKFPQKLAKSLVIMMGFNQLLTALIGGIIALIIIQMLYKRKQI